MQSKLSMQFYFIRDKSKQQFYFEPNHSSVISCTSNTDCKLLVHLVHTRQNTAHRAQRH